MTDFMTLAYLDPGTGSLIMQAILGGLAGAAVFFRAGRQRFFGKKKSDPAMNIEDEPATATDE